LSTPGRSPDRRRGGRGRSLGCGGCHRAGAAPSLPRPGGTALRPRSPRPADRGPAGRGAPA